VAHREEGVTFPLHRDAKTRVSVLLGNGRVLWIKILEAFIANTSLVSDN